MTAQLDVQANVGALDMPRGRDVFLRALIRDRAHTPAGVAGIGEIREAAGAGL